MSESYKAGELYLIGEVDLRTGTDLPFYKIGIVRDKENRSTDDRLREHQTGNPRLLRTHWTIRTPVVEQIETTLHGRFAPWRISGEWFHLDAGQLVLVHKTANDLARQAKEKETFLEVAEQLKTAPSSGAVLTPSSEAISLHQRLGELKANVEAAKNAVKKLKAHFDSLHEIGEDVSDFYSQTDRSGTLDFDEERFKTEYLHLWDEYQVTKARPDGRFIVTGLNAFKKDQSLIKPELLTTVQELDHQLTASEPSRAFMRQIHERFLEVLTIQAPLEWEESLVEAELKAICGEASEIDGLCTWNRKLKESASFDKTAFKNDHPELWARFTTRKEGTVSTALRRDRNYQIQ